MKLKFYLLLNRIQNFRLPRPTLRLPRVRAPQIKLPTLRLPQVKLPAIRLPQVKLPQVSLPKIKWPTIRMPRLSVPRVSLPKITRPKISLPSITIPKIPPPALPWNYRRIAPQMKNALGVTICVAFLITMGSNVATSGFYPFDLVKEIKIASIIDLKAKRDSGEMIQIAQQMNTLTPASGYDATTSEPAAADDGRYAIEEGTLNVEAVLIPHQNTVVSSSRDGKIQSINFDNGQLFKKGDILVEYMCKDLRAEVDIAKMQQDIAQKKSATSYKLFKLDIISDLEQQELKAEQEQALIRTKLYESRMENCFIRAEYDGRVVKRLANSGEFTRTDRVLMEVASLDYLKAEFLLPSRWLRWVNIGAPIEIKISETDETYAAEVQFIYGEVDPVSQSIQITAQLSPYDEPLLPGMSGQALIDIHTIRSSGIYGFLERKPPNYRQ